jgi:hypothetical protein
MRSAVVCALLALVIPAAAADRKKITEAESDGLLGSVKSVVTRAEVSNPQPPLPTSYMPGSIILPIPCWVCDYDSKGNRVRSGTDWDDQFVGETAQNSYDEAGSLQERIYHDEKGALIRHMFFGPSGLMKMESYRDGELFITQRIQYEDGGQTKLITFTDAKGAQTGRSKQRFGGNGSLIEAWNYGRSDVFLSHYTNVVDKETGAQTLTEFNLDRKVRLTWTARDHEIVSFWQEASATPQPGSRACFDIGPKSDKCEMYSADGSSTETIAEFLDEAKRIPMHTEFRDAHQQVQMTGDYEYDFDSHGNWVRRSVFVWANGSIGRKLIQVQGRTITYWSK